MWLAVAAVAVLELQKTEQVAVAQVDSARVLGSVSRLAQLILLLLVLAVLAVKDPRPILAHKEVIQYLARSLLLAAVLLMVMVTAVAAVLAAGAGQTQVFLRQAIPPPQRRLKEIMAA